MKWILLLPSLAYGNEMFCLTQNIYHEARGESLRGQIAVAYVTLNRVESSEFPNTICEVVHQDCQFSWRCKPPEPINVEKWNEAKNLANSILTHENPIKGSVYYYNPRKSSPSWRRKHCSKYIDIENHRFCLS